MGAGASCYLNLFCALHPNGLPPSFRLLEMGNTQTYGTVDEFAALFAYLCVPQSKSQAMAADYGSRLMPTGVGVYNLEMFPAAGVAYDCVDYSDPTTIKSDLNTDHLPARLRGRFDLVTNFGTSEHVANQMNFFHYVHDASKISGLMVHFVPCIGYLGHCLYKYDPKFFVRLAAANDYEILQGGFGPEEIGVTLDAECDLWLGYNALRGRRFDSHLVEFILRKRLSRSYRPPIDYGLDPTMRMPQTASIRSFPPQLALPPFVPITMRQRLQSQIQSTVAWPPVARLMRWVPAPLRRVAKEIIFNAL